MVLSYTGGLKEVRRRSVKAAMMHSSAEIDVSFKASAS